MINLEKLQEVKRRYAEVTALISKQETATDPHQMAELGPEHRELSDVVSAIEQYEAVLEECKDLREMIRVEDDDEIIKMAKDELDVLADKTPDLERNLRLKLIPKDPEDAKDAIVEIRAGAGGSEAALFAGDLFRLYDKYSERQGWKVSAMNSSPGSAGGFKEIIFGVSGRDVFGWLKYENGVHRVQRVPETESSGRLHTSAASVAVLPEADKVDIVIEAHEVKVDVYRSSGPGGQSVNTTDSAVRLTHIPTGLVVTCQDEKSQHKNKDKAMRVLRSRLYEFKLSEAHAERDAARRSAVGSGDRSVKIRTYNFPQDRVTDHRLEGAFKNFPLRKVIDGDLGALLNALRTADNADRLSHL